MFRLPMVLVVSAVLVSAGYARLQSSGSVTSESGRIQRSAPAPATQPKSGGSIKGRVVGDGGRAVADASILAFPVNVSSNPQGMVSSLLRPVSSDTDGRFELSSLQPGAYTLAAFAPGYVSSDSDAKPFYRPGENVTLTLVKGGVITGKVTNSSGDLVVGVVVRAIKIREADNKPLRMRGNFPAEVEKASLLTGMLGPFKTDDRGIYRIYGLAPGYYQVAAGGRGDQSFNPYGSAGAYDGDAPTYFPSSTIDTAAEVLVQAGDEATNIDIRYRDNRGHTISGTVSGVKESNRQALSILLTRASGGIPEATAILLPGTHEKGFAFNAVLDGDYLVTAMAGSGSMMEGTEFMDASVSPSRRVTVSGLDVTGIELALEPLASIIGRALIAPLPGAQQTDCENIPTARIEEVVITTRGEGKPKPEDQSSLFLSMFKDTTPTEKGEFTLTFLRAGVHRLDAQLPGDHLYMKSIVLPSPTPNGKPIDVAKSGLRLKSGDKVKGLLLTMSEGAAGVRGKVITGEDKKPPKMRMRSYLVPAEPDAADEVLRYAEADVAADGGFSFSNIAPGKYWLVAREVSDQEQAEADRPPVAWDTNGRVALRFEGEASRKVIELNRCQRTSDLVVSYIPLTKPSKPPTKAPGQ